MNVAVDQLVATFAHAPEKLVNGQVLEPLHMLGIPGWWSQNESDDFYDNAAYFRPGRRRDY